MDDSKRRAMIKAQAAKKKESGDVDPKGKGSSNPSIKGRCRPKRAVLPKSPKSFWSSS